MITLETRTWYPSTSLHARKIWQILFNYYRKRGGPLDRMDDMLCDLMTIERIVGKDFWWTNHGSWTQITQFEVKDSVKVSFGQGVITFREV